jgi:uncharacterized OB-fold protein
MSRYMPEAWTIPGITEQNAPFFTTGKLMLQRCTSCGAVQHPPEDLCLTCQGMEFEYVRAEGAGKVYSYTLPHHPASPMLRERVPYNVVLVQLDDYPHVRIVGNLIDAGIDEVKIGLPVQVTWEELPDGQGGVIRLPQWVRIRQG